MKSLPLIAAVCVVTPALADPPPHYRGDHALAKAGARASLTPDGPWLPGKIQRPTLLAARDTVGTRPEVEADDDDFSVHLWVYADPDGLADITTAETFLAPGAEPIAAPVDDHTPGMRLMGGWDFAEVTREGRLAHVTVILDADDPHGGRLEVHGYIPAEALGKTFFSKARSVAIPPPDVSLRPSFELLDTPGGKPFAIAKNVRYLRAAKLERRGGYTLVELEYSGIVGWVANAKLLRLGPPPPPGDGGMLTGEGVTTPRTLPVGTPLYDAIDGHAIGEVSGHFDRPVLEQTRGWQRFEVHTSFGVLPVWAKAPAP